MDCYPDVNLSIQYYVFCCVSSLEHAERDLLVLILYVQMLYVDCVAQPTCLRNAPLSVLMWFQGAFKHAMQYVIPPSSLVSLICVCLRRQPNSSTNNIPFITFTNFGYWVTLFVCLTLSRIMQKLTSQFERNLVEELSIGRGWAHEFLGVDPDWRAEPGCLPHF